MTEGGSAGQEGGQSLGRQTGTGPGFLTSSPSTWAGCLPCLSLWFLTCKSAEGAPPWLWCGQGYKRWPCKAGSQLGRCGCGADIYGIQAHGSQEPQFRASDLIRSAPQHHATRARGGLNGTQMGWDPQGGHWGIWESQAGRPQPPVSETRAAGPGRR